MHAMTSAVMAIIASVSPSTRDVVADAEVGDPLDVVLELQAPVGLEAVHEAGDAADHAERHEHGQVGRGAVRERQDADHERADERQEDQHRGVDHAACARK